MAMFGKQRKRTTYRRIMFVDPGLGGSGSAYWLELESHSTQHTRSPDAFAQWLPEKRSGPWLQRFDRCLTWYASLLETYEPQLVVIERPVVWDNEKSTASARSGNLLKLVMLVGGMIAVTPFVPVELPAPGEWKGQLPKRVMKKRLLKRFGQSFPEHAADAVAMGLAAQGGL